MKKVMWITSGVLFITSMILLCSVHWRIAVGVLLFGWVLNIDNKFFPR